MADPEQGSAKAPAGLQRGSLDWVFHPPQPWGSNAPPPAHPVSLKCLKSQERLDPSANTEVFSRFEHEGCEHRDCRKGEEAGTRLPPPKTPASLAFPPL